jgi:hypothetical protein
MVVGAKSCAEAPRHHANPRRRRDSHLLMVCDILSGWHDSQPACPSGPIKRMRKAFGDMHSSAFSCAADALRAKT